MVTFDGIEEAKQEVEIQISDGDQLTCPHCNQDNGLHQERVQIFYRDAEDGVASVFTVGGVGECLGRAIEGKSMATISRSAKAPGRRDTIRIFFSCEHAGNREEIDWFLEIQQHKGMTLVAWKKKETR